MSELFFVVKCFVYMLLITFLMQTKISGISIEAHAEYYLKKSGISAYLQDASAGGVQLLHDGYAVSKSFVLDSTRSFRSSESQESKASRR